MSAPLVWVPNVETFLLAAGLLFGVGGLLVMAIGAVVIIRRERQIDRARAASAGVQFDHTTYPGRAIR